MSLKAFHIFFVAVSAILGFFLLLWGLDMYRTLHEGLYLALGGVGLMLLVGLIPYYRWFRKKMSRIASLVLFSLLSGLADIAQACPVCFGDPNSPMIQSIKSGIIVLIVVIGGVLSAIAFTAWTWSRRAKALESKQ